jgi:hypothetical protein
MRQSCSFGRSIKIAIGAGAAAVLLSWIVVPASAASSETSSVVSSSPDNWVVQTKQGQRSPDKRYFIEFRARSAADYGHMYVEYGMVNAHDEIVDSRIAGLHPTGDAANCYNCSLFNWTVGHVIFVPSDTGASDGDLEEKYVTARYRVWMDKAHYKELDTYIRKLQHDNPLWNALWNNCVDFGRRIAEHMGLKIPLFIWMEPKTFVDEMREMNGIKKEQLPLADAANPLRSTTLTAADRTPLPPPRPKLIPVSVTRPAPSNAAPSAKPKKQAAMQAPGEQAMASSATHGNNGSLH